MANNYYIRDFNRIREYMHDFYIYGFRTGYYGKSKETYENEKNHIRLYLGDYMQFRQGENGNNRVYFISFDSRDIYTNPLYRAWKAKLIKGSYATIYFTVMDIFEILKKDGASELTQQEIVNKFYNYNFASNDKLQPLVKLEEYTGYDVNAVKARIREYTDEGILRVRKEGRKNMYSRIERNLIENEDALRFFSEAVPCGILGNYLLDNEDRNGYIRFKNHYITGTMDSEITYIVLDAISSKEKVVLKKYDSRDLIIGIPLFFMESVYNGRQYVMLYNKGYFSVRIDKIKFASRLSDAKSSGQFRLWLEEQGTTEIDEERRAKIIQSNTDRIKNTKPVTEENYNEIKNEFYKYRGNIWGVNTGANSGEKTSHVEFTVRYKDNEKFIRSRMEREKRYGTVTDLERDEEYNYCRFEADLFDVLEIKPWIFTFVGRIVDINLESINMQKKHFTDHLSKMAEYYSPGCTEERNE